MSKKTINVALIGHKFVAKAHNHGYTDVTMFFNPGLRPVKHTLCARGDDLAEIAELWGWQHYTQDWQEVIANPEIEVIDICAPSLLHKEIAIAAARAGKHVLCEKPLAMTSADAREMLEEVNRARVVHAIGFNFRKTPAMAYARQLIENGEIGRIFHFRGFYSQDWLIDPLYPLTWRLRKKDAGYGSSADLGAHVIDLAHYLVGSIDEVIGMQSTFIKERPIAVVEDGLKAIAGDSMGVVDVDDASSFLARFSNGAHGIFEQTRYATGNKNLTRIEIYGSEGAILWNGFEEMNDLYLFSRQDKAGSQGFRKIQVSEGMHPYIANWFPPGHIIGYGDSFIHEIYDFLNAIEHGGQASPSFVDGVRCQEVIDAVERSVVERRWVKTAEVD